MAPEMLVAQQSAYASKLCRALELLRGRLSLDACWSVARHLAPQFSRGMLDSLSGEL